MSMHQTSGQTRGRSPMTRYRSSQLPFPLREQDLLREDDLEDEDSSRENQAAEKPVFRLFTVRLCPAARRRISRLLEMPHLHPEVRQIYCGLLAWASD